MNENAFDKRTIVNHRQSNELTDCTATMVLQSAKCMEKRSFVDSLFTTTTESDL